MRRALPVVLAAIGVSVFLLSPTGVYHALTGDDERAQAVSERSSFLKATLEDVRRTTLGTWELSTGGRTGTFRIVESTGRKSADSARMRTRRALSLVTSAYACGSHSLVAAADACVDEYFLPVDVVSITGDFTKPQKSVLPDASVTTHGDEPALLILRLDRSTTIMARMGDKVEILEPAGTTLRRLSRD
jgi:hypothetical protein